MAAGLYRHDPVFTESADAVLDLLGDAGHAVRADWLSEAPDASIDAPGRAQPLLFAVEYALGRMVQSWGAGPAAVLGHSAGELVGAVLAGVIDLADAVRMVDERVGCLRDAPAGGMIAVVGGAEELSPYLTGDVAIAAVNSKRQTMLAGTTGHLADVSDKLRAGGYSVAPVPATVPFQSSAPALGALPRQRPQTVRDDRAGLPLTPLPQLRVQHERIGHRPQRLGIRGDDGLHDPLAPDAERHTRRHASGHHRVATPPVAGTVHRYVQASSARRACPDPHLNDRSYVCRPRAAERPRGGGAAAPTLPPNTKAQVTRGVTWASR
ncbi:acyltransferase domain-containing protein [Streptomyces sp. NPDC017529]|uniref:acyltransferase domain-containing protein n=1 Tax=Streptomyces sp. NPDC017529 TaxID=3365000 RepID=UPI0037A2D2FE